MKKIVIALLTVVTLTSSVFADKAKVTFNEGVVEIHANDLDYAKDAVFEQSALHPKATIKVYATPLPQPNVKALLKGEKSDIRLSLDKTLVKDYQDAYNSILAEMEKQEPEAAKKMKANPYDMRGNLAFVEQYLGLDRINPQELSLTARCHRVCWVEGIYRYKHAEGIKLIFK